MTINGIKEQIKGASKDIVKYKANIGALANAYDSTRKKTRQFNKAIDKSSNKKSVKYDTKSIEDYINNYKKDFNPNDITGMTINGKTFEIKKIAGYSKEVKKLTGNLKELRSTSNIADIKVPEIDSSKLNIKGYSTGNYETIKPDANSFNLLETLKTKIEQIKPAMQQFKQSLSSVGGNNKELELVKYKISEIEEKLEKAKNGKIHLNTKEIIEAEAQLERLNNKKEKMEKGNSGKGFSTIFSNIGKVIPKMNEMSGITIKIKNQIKQWSSGFKNGLGHILKYAGALFSLQSIYSTLSGCAQSWLSSQNAGAKQLSANIDYMKYAMGSAFAPVIQYVTNLVYQLMKAIQSVVYALFKVNIFANASAKSYASMAGSAKKASKETNKMADIDEIHNIQKDSGSSGGSGGGGSAPSFDLSKVNGMNNSIIDAIKNGDWYSVGKEIGLKINEAMNNIPWDKIQNTAKKIGTNIALFLNGAIDTINWYKLGDTLAQGLNTAVYLLNSFVTTLNWTNVGVAIGNSINGLFQNIDWATAGQTLGQCIIGIFTTINNILETIDWQNIGNQIVIFFSNIDFTNIANTGMKIIINLINGIIQILPSIINTSITVFSSFLNGISQQLPTLIPMAVEMILTLVTSLLDNIDKIIDAGINLIIALAEGLIKACPKLIEKAPIIIEKLLNAIITNAPKLIAAGWQLIVKLVSGIIEYLPKVIESAGQIIETINEKLKELPGKALEWGKDMIQGFIDGIKNMLGKVGESAQEIGNKIKEYLHFSRPDKGPLREYEKWMPDMIQGLAKTLENSTPKLYNASKNLAQKIADGLDMSKLFDTASYKINTEVVSNFPDIVGNVKNNNYKPQNIIEETMMKALNKDNTGNTINFVNELKVNGKIFAREIIQDLNDEAKRLGYKPILERG